MNIAPVNKDGCTFGKRTGIPGMAKFDELSKLKVWTETCNDEIAHWARGIREMPPDRTFRVDDPIKMAANCVEGKPAFARRAVDVQKDKARRRVQSTSGGAGEVEMTVQELSAFMDSLRDTSRTPLEKLEADRYNAHWRGPSRGPEGERATLHAGTASEGGNMRCRTPIASSHEIGWNTQPLVKPGNYSMRLQERCRRKSCNETLFADAYFTTTRIPFSSKFAGTGR